MVFLIVLTFIVWAICAPETIGDYHLAFLGTAFLWKKHQDAKRNAAQQREDKWAADLAKMDPGERPEYQSIAGPGGQLQDPYRLKGGPAIQADERGLEAIRQRALQEGPSAWLNMAQDQQRMEQRGAMQSAAAQRRAGLTEAMDAQASRGGLSTGAAQRAAQRSAQQGALGLQDIMTSGMKQRGLLGLRDEENRLGLLSRLPGMEQAAAAGKRQERQYTTGVDQFNLANILQDKYAKNQYDLDRYKDARTGWAAERTAQATERAAYK